MIFFIDVTSNLQLCVIPVDGSAARLANVVTTLFVGGVLRWWSCSDVQNEGAHLFRCCHTLLHLTSRHHTRGCLWVSWFSR